MGIYSTLPSSGPQSDVQFFTTPGSFTWTKPVTTFSWCHILCIGAGGGGGSGQLITSATAPGGGGGGAGAYVIAAYPFVTLPNTLTVAVGAGGAGGVSATYSSPNTGNQGGNGGESNVMTSGQYLARCTGGNGSFTGGGGNFTTSIATHSNFLFTAAGANGSAGTAGAAGSSGLNTTIAATSGNAVFQNPSPFSVVRKGPSSGSSGGGAAASTSVAGGAGVPVDYTGLAWTASITPTAYMVPGSSATGGTSVFGTGVTGGTASNSAGPGSGGSGGGSVFLVSGSGTVGGGGKGGDGVVVIWCF